MFDGKKFRLLRVNAGLQQMDIAKQFGCKSTEIWRYEAGRVEPREERIVQLAKMLNCKPEDLVKSEAQQAGSTFSQEDTAIVKALIEMDAVRRAKVIGYVEGYLASGSHNAATLVSDVAGVLETSLNAAGKPGRRPAKPKPANP